MTFTIHDIMNDSSGIVYLVVDPSIERELLLDKTARALEGGVDILQIWNHWPGEPDRPDKEQLVGSVLELASEYEVPVLINEEWELLKTTELDGVHFENVPKEIGRIRREIGRDFIAGITCGNDLEVVAWADENGMDYISFCAMFPSPSVGECEIVRPETVRRARERTSLPLFLSGGITPGKITGPLAELESEFDGVAVISGIMNADEPREQAASYKRALNEHAATGSGTEIDAETKMDTETETKGKTGR